ncbi:MAG: prepilin-type N-terminal cleavage/methylation domain-containing protein [Lachnospiraceae bacterium]
MIQKMKNKKSNKKGFTLVELIVVLVILGILIAMLVPTLTGYIDKANKQKAQANAKMLLTATQSMAAEEYQVIEADVAQKAKAALLSAPGTPVTLDAKIQPLGSDVTLETLAEIKGKYGTGTTVTCLADGTVSGVTFVTQDEKFRAIYENNAGATKWTVTKLK